MAVRQAFHIATTGRPGPTLIDVPKDCLQNEMEWYWPTDQEVLDSLPGYRPNVKGHPRMIKEAARLIMASERPVIYAGGGILKARAAEALRELAELIDSYVVTTLMARGAFPDSHPLCLGMPGMHGNATAITALQKADLLITLGARFDDRITGKVDAFAPVAKVIHVDIDPAEQGKVRRPDVPIVGDAKYVIEEIISEIKAMIAAGAVQADTSAWKSKVSGWREQFPMTYEQSEPGAALKPQYCIEELNRLAAPHTIVASGVGQHQMYTSQFFEFDEPYTWVNSGGLGTMGFSIPAAIGAKAAKPECDVWAVDGDGCFQMTAQELVTATVEGLPIKVALLNNSYLGMVRQWQEMFYDERYSEVYLNAKVPDFVMWAESMGCVGILVESPEEVGPAIEKANSIKDRSVVIEFRTDASELVFPMVPAGSSNDDLILHPTQQDRAEAPEVTTINQYGGQTLNHHILSVLVQNRPGVLARVSSLFARRGFNIFSLAVAPAEDEGMSRITIVVDVESTPLEQITKQLFKLIDVVKISELDPRRSVERELLIATVKAPDEQRGKVVELINIFEGKIIAVAESALTVSLEGHPDKLDDFEDLLAGYGIVELQRTGRVALPKLDRGARLRAVNQTPTPNTGKAG